MFTQKSWMVDSILFIGYISAVYSSSNMDNSRRLSADQRHVLAPYVFENMPLLQVYLGNPAQQRTFAVSTSSDFTALPCQDCTSCGEHRSPDDFYQFEQSSTFKRVVGCDACSVGTTCFEGTDRCLVGKSMPDKSSWVGYEVTDKALSMNNVMSQEEEESNGELQSRTIETGNIETGSSERTEKRNSISGTDKAAQYGFDLNFFCQTTTRGYYNHVMDGILGLSKAPTSFLSQMHAAGKLGRPTFSICHNPQKATIYFQKAGARVAATATTTTTSGVVTLGGYDEGYLDSDMLYAQAISDDSSTSYKVMINKFYLQSGNDKEVNYDTGVSLLGPDAHELDFSFSAHDTDTSSFLLDTSTTFLNFDEKLGAAFKKAWKDLTGKEYTKASENMSESELKALPTIVLELKGAEKTLRELNPLTVPALTADYNVLISIPASHYMQEAPVTSQRFRPEIHFDSKSGSTFGLNAMRGHTISFESDYNRIGFANSKDCPKISELWGAAQSRNGFGDSAPLGRKYGENEQKAMNNNVDVYEDDDIYVSEINFAKNEPISVYDKDYIGGLNCNTASCRSLMSIGYVLVGTVLAVAYRLSRPKEKQLYGSFLNQGMDADGFDEVDDEGLETYNGAAYRRTGWNIDDDAAGGTLGTLA